MMSALLLLMNTAVDKAAESLLADFHALKNLEIQVKGAGDFVTVADTKSEKIIVEMLKAEKPEWGFLGEEGTEIIGSDSRYRWIIDPLDGTCNFLHGVPHWCITIALEKEGEIIAGMTYDPLLNEKFYAEKTTAYL